MAEDKVELTIVRNIESDIELQTMDMLSQLMSIQGDILEADEEERIVAWFRAKYGTSTYELVE